MFTSAGEVDAAYRADLDHLAGLFGNSHVCRHRDGFALGVNVAGGVIVLQDSKLRGAPESSIGWTGCLRVAGEALVHHSLANTVAHTASVVLAAATPEPTALPQIA